MVKGDSTESSSNPFFTESASNNPFFSDGDEDDDDHEDNDDSDESKSNVGWPTEHPIKRKSERRRGSRPRKEEKSTKTATVATTETPITLPEWLVELPEDLEVPIS